MLQVKVYPPPARLHFTECFNTSSTSSCSCWRTARYSVRTLKLPSRGEGSDSGGSKSAGPRRRGQRAVVGGEHEIRLPGLAPQQGRGRRS